MTEQIPLQADVAAQSLLNYGVLGVVALLLGYFAWHQLKRHEKQSDEWKTQSHQSNEKLTELNFKNQALHEKYQELFEKQLQQSKDFHESTTHQIDKIPERVIRELEYQELKKKHDKNQQAPPHTTPSP